MIGPLGTWGCGGEAMRRQKGEADGGSGGGVLEAVTTIGPSKFLISFYFFILAKYT